VAAVVVEAESDEAPSHSRFRLRQAHPPHLPPGIRFRSPCWNGNRLQPQFRIPSPHPPRLPPRHLRAYTPALQALASTLLASRWQRSPSRKSPVSFAQDTSRSCCASIRLEPWTKARVGVPELQFEIGIRSRADSGPTRADARRGRLQNRDLPLRFNLPNHAAVFPTDGWPLLLHFESRCQMGRHRAQEVPPRYIVRPCMIKNATVK